MAGKRTDKVAKQIQKDLGELLNEMKQTHFKGAWITTMDVVISPDLGYAKVYVGIMPMGNEKKEELFQLLEVNNPEIRHRLAQRVKHQLRKVPELTFFMDDTLDRAERLEVLFRKLGDNKDQA